jgi:hypothetical protein
VAVQPIHSLGVVVVQRCGNYLGTEIRTIQAVDAHGHVLAQVRVPPEKRQGSPAGRPADAYGTILEMGSSRMSVAPWALSSGMSVFTYAFSTTVSMA